jgi:4-carboxymuconolactone decarboxylase
MARLDILIPGELDPAQRQLYEAITGGPRAAGPQLFRLTDDTGGLAGPFNAMLYAPAVGAALQELGAAIRYRTGLPDRTREIAILLVAAQWDSAVERDSHEAIGRACGLTEDEIGDLRAGRPPDLTDDQERAAYELVRALLLRGDLDDSEHAAAVAVLGSAAIVELSTLVGYYSTLALQLRIFRVAH